MLLVVGGVLVKVLLVVVLFVIVAFVELLLVLRLQLLGDGGGVGELKAVRQDATATDATSTGSNSSISSTSNVGTCVGTILALALGVRY